MDSYQDLLQKLESFIRRYYVNELIRGAILFVSIGLLYFLLTLLVEYFLWLGVFGRQLLFWSFILVEMLLLGKFLVIPLLKLFKLSKGLDHRSASVIIGEHFPEVKDKLLNLLQLKQDPRQTELLLAGIEQKAVELKPVPFTSAVDFKLNFKYLKYALLPIMLLAVIFVSGNSNLFADSYTRVVNYKTAYEPPAPFSFLIVNESLKVRENDAYTLQIRTEGQLVPENVSVNFEGQTYFLNSTGPGSFQFTFESVRQPIDFSLSANGVTSREYSLEVVRVPRLLDFEMFLDFPNYTGREDEILDGSGNATVPEGTSVEWRLKTISTEKVKLVLGDSTEEFQREGRQFHLSRTLREDLNYQITTSNKEVAEYEKLEYSLKVEKDQHPRLELKSQLDSIDNQTWYFHGTASDDYRVQNVQLKYYPEEAEDEIKTQNISIGNANIVEFISAFPGALELEEGRSYSFYFQVTDNDALHKGKSVKSQVFNYRKPTVQEAEQELLKQQNEAIQGLDGSFEKMELSEKQLQELSRLQKEQGALNYNDRKKLESFLKRQQQQNSMMKHFTEKLKSSLEESNHLEQDPRKEQLQERLERKEEKLQENEELLKELEKYSEMIQQEDLGKKLEELSKRNQNQEKNLQQLLELTKRYYVSEKTAQLSRELEQLAEKQEDLSEHGEENTKAKQDSLNKDFEDIQERLEELEKENEGLKKPMDLGREEDLEKQAGEEQKKASENLDEQKSQEAKKNQKKAAEAMKKMAGNMKQQQQSGGMEQMQEDVTMLRQILDNLLVFSFEQEALMKDFQGMERNSPQFASKLRQQNLLKDHFKHVDDSLYSLALRNPLITENITEKLTNVEYDLAKSLERLAENQLAQGIGSQQYVVTGANDLAFFLSDILQNMQQMMQGSPGQGEGQGEQLPDIIQKQGELGEKMKEGIGEQQQQGGGDSEEMNGRLFEIFQEQQLLRKALEKKLEEEGLGGAGDGLKKEMEQLEQEILEKGFSEEVLQRMQQMEHKLLDLEEARLQQGQKEERESETNRREFGEGANNQILRAKEYFNTTEILNRQALPLRQIYQRKVREYFEKRDN